MENIPDLHILTMENIAENVHETRPMDTPDIRIDDTISNMEDISNTEVFMGTENSLGAGATQTNARSITPLSDCSQDSCHDEHGAIEKGEIDVKVKKRELSTKLDRSNSSVEAGMPEYKMTAYPRGLALIIEIEDYENNVASKRHGSHADVTNLKSLFEQLHFHIQYHRNLKRIDFYRVLTDFASAPEHRDADMMIMVILSHGRESAIITADGTVIATEEIYKRFNNTNCPGLRGKPKFFIVQACRGDDTDSGMMDEEELYQDSDQIKVKFLKRRREGIDSIPMSICSELDHARPTWEDMCIAYSTIPGYTSQRDPDKGTWFIQALVEIFMNHSHEKELIDLLRMTSDYLSKFTNSYGEKQTCNVEMRHLYKRIYFNPGIGGKSRLRRVSGTKTKMSPKPLRRSMSTPPSSPLAETNNDNDFL